MISFLKIATEIRTFSSLFCFKTLQAHSPNPIPSLLDVTLEATNPNTFVYCKHFVPDMKFPFWGIRSRKSSFTYYIGTIHILPVLKLPPKKFNDVGHVITCTWSFGQGGWCSHSTILSIMRQWVLVNSLATWHYTDNAQPITAYSCSTQDFLFTHRS